MATYKELLAQRAELEKQIDEARHEEVAVAVAQARQLISEYGLTALDCGFRFGGNSSGLVAEKIRTSVAVKFRGPNGETWSGRGKAPTWLVTLEKLQNRNRAEFLVAR